jgi:hypothetical protein
MTLKEFMEWMAFFEEEPWGSAVDGTRMAVNTAGIYNAGLLIANPKKLRSNQFTHKQFLVGVKPPPPKKQTWEEQKAILNRFPKRKVSK